MRAAGAAALLVRLLGQCDVWVGEVSLKVRIVATHWTFAIREINFL